MSDTTLAKFPSNFRFITEFTSAKGLFYTKIFCFSFITTFLMVCILLRGFQLFQGIQVLHAATNHRDALVNEQKYWEDVVSRHQGYRDAEFKLAVVSYQLGDKVKARSSLTEALAIDPNFTKGREFAKQVGL
ncbi:hypothetical protein BH09PAT1_BH09PAT1_0370 [soil metagenome]